MTNTYTGKFHLIFIKPKWWQLFTKPYMKLQLETQKHIVEREHGAIVEDYVEYKMVDCDTKAVDYLMYYLPTLRVDYIQVSDGDCVLCGHIHRKPYNRVDAMPVEDSIRKHLQYIYGKFEE